MAWQDVQLRLNSKKIKYMYKHDFHNIIYLYEVLIYQWASLVSRDHTEWLTSRIAENDNLKECSYPEINRLSSFIQLLTCFQDTETIKKCFTLFL